MKTGHSQIQNQPLALKPGQHRAGCWGCWPEPATSEGKTGHSYLAAAANFARWA